MKAEPRPRLAPLGLAGWVAVAVSSTAAWWTWQAGAVLAIPLAIVGCALVSWQASR